MGAGFIYNSVVIFYSKPRCFTGAACYALVVVHTTITATHWVYHFSTGRRVVDYNSRAASMARLLALGIVPVAAMAASAGAYGGSNTLTGATKVCVLRSIAPFKHSNKHTTLTFHFSLLAN